MAKDVLSREKWLLSMSLFVRFLSRKAKALEGEVICFQFSLREIQQAERRDVLRDDLRLSILSS